VAAAGAAVAGAPQAVRIIEATINKAITKYSFFIFLLLEE
jgi:hypothetical protein